ncbi:MAG: hypothetical protein NTW73_02975 [Candidatus Parcubacteria bacterium]|nr:hypothetical protein [Candidatus Parcubacteria bacterium]
MMVWMAWMEGRPVDTREIYYHHLECGYKDVPLFEHEKIYYEIMAREKGHPDDTPCIKKLVNRFIRENPDQIIEETIFFDTNRIGFLEQWERVIAPKT